MTRHELHYRWEWTLDAPPEVLWPLVSDTDRFNRDTGVPPVEPSAGDRPGRRRLRLRRFGVLVEWDEEPFEWLAPQRFSVVRRYRRGPLREMRIAAELYAHGTGTKLVYEVRARPARAAWRPAAAFQIGVLSRRRFDATFRRYAALAQAPQPSLAPAAEPTLPPGAGERIARARATLDGVAPTTLVARLVELLTSGDESVLARLRPYALADAWGAPRRAVLELCLHATRAGLLDLRWELLCPLCRGAKETAEHLADVHPRVHCDSCNIDYTVSFDRSVEVTFRPNAAVRSVELREFCVGGPQVTPHVVAQALVPAGAETALELALAAGMHRLRAAGIAGGCDLEVSAGGSSHGLLTLAEAGWSADGLAVAARSSLRVANATAAPQLIVLERTAWSDQAATAAQVTALQTFRDLFASEALRPQEPLSVGNLTLVFTDLRASTRYYREVGDAAAFGRVMRHIDVVREAVAAQGGAVVKTMGDAVMAVFSRPVDAIRAALSSQSALAASPPGVAPLRLKIGIHHGPCIAIAQDGRLDYFGSTVNAASRLVALSSGGDVVVTAALCEDPEVREALDAGEFAAEPFAAELRGLEGDASRLCRLRQTEAR